MYTNKSGDNENELARQKIYFSIGEINNILCNKMRLKWFNIPNLTTILSFFK